MDPYRNLAKVSRKGKNSPGSNLSGIISSQPRESPDIHPDGMCLPLSTRRGLTWSHIVMDVMCIDSGRYLQTLSIPFHQTVYVALFFQRLVMSRSSPHPATHPAMSISIIRCLALSSPPVWLMSKFQSFWLKGLSSKIHPQSKAIFGRAVDVRKWL